MVAVLFCGSGSGCEIKINSMEDGRVEKMICNVTTHTILIYDIYFVTHWNACDETATVTSPFFHLHARFIHAPSNQDFFDANAQCNANGST